MTDNTNVPVVVTNWGDYEPVPPCVRKTTVKTWIIDPAGVAGPKNTQICDYEPTRNRMQLIVVDFAVSLTNDSPTASPDPGTTSALAPQGAYLPVNVQGQVYNLFGPDAFWINSLGTITRVTVIKEYL